MCENLVFVAQFRSNLKKTTDLHRLHSKFTLQNVPLKFTTLPLKAKVP